MSFQFHWQTIATLDDASYHLRHYCKQWTNENKNNNKKIRQYLVAQTSPRRTWTVCQQWLPVQTTHFFQISREERRGEKISYRRELYGGLMLTERCYMHYVNTFTPHVPSFPIALPFSPPKRYIIQCLQIIQIHKYVTRHRPIALSSPRLSLRWTKVFHFSKLLFLLHAFWVLYRGFL